MNTLTARLLSLGLLVAAPAIQAQDESASGVSPLMQGGYLAPMFTYDMPHGERLDDGYGGTLAAGYRNDWWALEIAGYQVGLDTSEDGPSPELFGGALNGLLFPFSGLPNLYGIATVGAAELDKYPIPAAGFGNAARQESIKLIRAGGGLGYLFPISFGRYDMAVRAEALYVAGYRDKEAENLNDIDAERHFNDTVINVGLQLPLGFRADPPPPPPVEPVAVVAPVAICADGQDNDADGRIDFPADPGCSTADDGDETDPPVCSDGKDNDGDGLIDFPNDKGCEAADDGDETDPCKTPEAGERISLKGCGTGDIIVLRGVNFEFDKARLTVNAQTILDNVAEELTAYPELKIELSGHTDAKGSDEYNQRLSDRRAAAVKTYLVGKGIDGDRMTTIGYGESKPVADNETDEGRELNRRTELRVTEGVAPGGPAVQVEAPVSAEPEAAPAADAAAPEAAAP